MSLDFVRLYEGPGCPTLPVSFLRAHRCPLADIMVTSFQVRPWGVFGRPEAVPCASTLVPFSDHESTRGVAIRSGCRGDTIEVMARRGATVGHLIDSSALPSGSKLHIFYDTFSSIFGRFRWCRPFRIGYWRPESELS